MTENPSVENKKITDFIPDSVNANAGTEKGMLELDDSVSKLGLGRSIVVDKHGNVIAGNKTHETAINNGFEDAIVVKTDGKQLVVVQRDDLDLYSTTDDKAKLLGIYDNRTSEMNLSWDDENLDKLLQVIHTDDVAIMASLSSLAEENDLIPLGDRLDSFIPDDDRYQENYGVIVICGSESQQQEVYNRLLADGYEVKVVVT